MIVIYENIKEQITADRLKVVKIRLLLLIMLLIPWKDTAPSVGIDNKNEILEESYLLNYKNLAAVMVIPDLLTPGTNEKICKSPINIADL